MIYNHPMKILLIEDEQKLAHAVKRALELQTYAVDAVYDGEGGCDMVVGEKTYDLIISDVMLPGMSGLEICKEVRKAGIQTPFLLLTAKGQIQDKVEGLDIGADDYMVKPFSFDELFARVRALMRRPKGERNPVLKIDDLVLDPTRFKVTRQNTDISLSSREFSLLEYMMRNENTVISKDTIISHVWNYDAEILPGTVEVHMKHLRDKVDVPFRNKLIHTIRGFGYELKNNNYVR